MSIVIIGGGAIGLLVAGRLAQSAHQVALLARPGTVDTLHTQPLRITYRGKTQTMDAPPAASEPAALPARYQHPDLVILCVKSYDTRSVLPTLAALQPEQLLTLQNGIGNEEFLAAQCGANRVLSGAITSSVEILAPGHIRITKMGGIGLAVVDSTPGLTLWGAVLSNAWFRVRQYFDYRALKWSKLLLNMLGNATPAILDMPLKEVYADARLVALERQAFLEALAVMQRRSIRPVNLPSYPAATLAAAMQRLPQRALFPLLRRTVAGGRGGKLPSLHADLRRGRRESEGEYLYGAIVHAARELQLAAPVNRALWQALHGIASGAIDWERFRQQPERLLTLAQQNAEMQAIH